MARSPADERVLCVHRGALDALGEFEGVEPEWHPWLFRGDLATWRRRAEVEGDPDWKQLIPYVAIRHRGKVLVCQRSRAGAEQRLLGKLTIGIGGHVDFAHDYRADPVPEDVRILGAFQRGLRRELREEIRVEGDAGRLEYLGLVNDDSDDVGRVHLGVCYTLEVPDPVLVSSAGPELALVEWASPDAILTGPTVGTLERWSLMVAGALVAREAGVAI